MTTLALSDLTDAEREKLAALPLASRLPVDELYHRDGRALSDDTLNHRITEHDCRTLQRQSGAGYQSAVREEMLKEMP